MKRNDHFQSLHLEVENPLFVREKSELIKNDAEILGKISLANNIKTKSFEFLVHRTCNKRRAVKLFLAWFLIGTLFGLVAVGRPDGLFVQLGERLPYLFGINIAMFHAMAGDIVAADRALVNTVFMTFVIHLLLLPIAAGYVGMLPLFKSETAIDRDDESRKRNPNKCSAVLNAFVAGRLFVTAVIFIGYFYQVIRENHFSPKRLKPVAMTIRANWMEQYENRSILELVLPGSHDSGAIVGELTGSPFFFSFIEPLSATNQLTIAEQLRVGIRSIDLRLCGAADGVAKLCHGPLLHYGSFLKALEEINSFVEEHPSEIVFVYARSEATQLLDDELERSVYGPIVNDFTSFTSKLINPRDRRKTIKELTSIGRNLIFASSLPESDTIFSDLEPLLWDDFRQRGLYDEPIYLDRTLFTEYIKGYLCEPETQIDKADLQVLTLGCSMTPRIPEEIIYNFFPMTTAMIFQDQDVGYSSLKNLAEIANHIALEYLKDEECVGVKNVHIISHDYLHDDIIQAIINKNNF